MDPSAYEKMLDTLHIISKDPKIMGLHIEVRTLRFGWSQLYEIHAAIRSVAESGTRVTAYLTSGSDREILLASAAHHITMPPPAEVYLTGVAASVRFYGSALQRLGVEADLESAGAYKSFGEAYTRSAPTPENREAMDHLLGDLHDNWLETLGQGRSMEVAQLDDALRSAPLSSENAVQRGLIDAARYADEDWTAWEEYLGGEPRKISFGSFGRLRRLLAKLPMVRKKKAIVAVVHLDGPVVERREQMPRSGRVIASDDVVPVIEELTDNEQIKAVVLAVNSPGGSALASDLISRSVMALKEKKPVLASMGNVAASGGYYISAEAHEIWAHKATITGSIGVVGGKLVLGSALGKLGVHSSWMGPAPDPGLLAPHTRFHPEQRRRFRASLRRVYDRFISIVASGRGKTTDEIEPVAQGRVWTGSQAMDNGLVDSLGTLKDAVRAAAVRASLNPERIKTIPVRFDPPKFGALSQFMRAGTHTPLDMAVGFAGADGLSLQLIYGCSGDALALEPSVLDAEVWVGWLSP
uniref:Periplasmic serine proteases (Clpp class) n=1 Tax=uncultured delta proteobacterium HF0070_10I02 TaxID=710824 RepID=E0XS22_9DELT|nr:periplasmic serine proteases (clpp class) [uncultured delta proteobacterium HF0070_10I02]